jgi:putative transposase
MGLRFPPQIYGQCFFVTTSFREHARHGELPGMYAALAESLAFYTRRDNAGIIAYCFMPTHLHLILVIDGARLGRFMRDFKKYIAQKKAADLRIEEPNVWEERYDRVVMTTEPVLRQKVEYIHQNPVKAGLTARPEFWEWSSAGLYLTGKPGPLPVFMEWS